MTDKKARRPTTRDIAGSAADLRGYATLFRGYSANADENGKALVPAITLSRAANFFDSVVDELLTLIEDEPIDPVKK